MPIRALVSPTREPARAQIATTRSDGRRRNRERRRQSIGAVPRLAPQRGGAEQSRGWAEDVRSVSALDDGVFEPGLAMSPAALVFPACVQLRRSRRLLSKAVLGSGWVRGMAVPKSRRVRGWKPVTLVGLNP